MNHSPSSSNSSFSFSSLVLEGRSERQRWTRTILFILLAALGASSLCAEPGAELVVPKPDAWTGQRLPFFVELRAEGSFKGAASFDLPEIQKTVIIKIGSPILSSENDGDTETFVQRHEFALFSQASGPLELPSITARFSHTKGYTGPTFDTSEVTEATTLTLKRPPDSDGLGFLVTTDSLDIAETWDPAPGPLETGTVLKRSIVQRAAQLTGIALKPAPTPEIEGVRTYSGSPEVTDKTERGDFLGERRETLTYLVQQPGLHTLPKIRYDWWNPATETLESLTLPAVTFTATSPPPPPEKPSPVRYLWLILPAAMIATVLLNRRRLASALHKLHEWIDPPPRRASRAFLKACESNDPNRAIKTWDELRTHHPKLNPSGNLIKEIQTLYEISYGLKEGNGKWSGSALARSYRQSEDHVQLTSHQSHLPKLNP